MLVINNIEKLEHKMLGQWSIEGVETDFAKTKHYNYNYTIRLSRNGVGAAIIIERTEGEIGYNVSVCYEQYDNVISVNAVGKNELKNKHILFSLIQGILDSEYNKKN